jgi:hypothetical protein
VRGFNKNTRNNYIRDVRAFAAFHRPVAGHGDGRGFAPLPATPDAERRAAAEHQQRGLRIVVLATRV